MLKSLKSFNLNLTNIISKSNNNNDIIKYSNLSLEQIQSYFQYSTFAILGYNQIARSKALNLKDNKLKVIIGTKLDNTYEQAIYDGFIPNINLFNIGDASAKGNIIMNLLSNADQIQSWNKSVLPHLTKNKTLYFSNGFNILFGKQTGIIPPYNIDIIMIKPDISSQNIRTYFIAGKKFDSKLAIYQDKSNFTEQNARYIGAAFGSSYMHKTTIDNEVYNNLIKSNK
jgi:ketol-acid reductoisomerase